MTPSTLSLGRRAWRGGGRGHKGAAVAPGRAVTALSLFAQYYSVVLNRQATSFGGPRGRRQVGNPLFHHGLGRFQGASGSPQDALWGRRFFCHLGYPVFDFFKTPSDNFICHPKAPPTRPQGDSKKPTTNPKAPTRLQDGPLNRSLDCPLDCSRDRLLSRFVVHLVTEQ